MATNHHGDDKRDRDRADNSAANAYRCDTHRHDPCEDQRATTADQRGKQQQDGRARTSALNRYARDGGRFCLDWATVIFGYVNLSYMRPSYRGGHSSSFGEMGARRGASRYVASMLASCAAMANNLLHICKGKLYWPGGGGPDRR